MLSFFTIVVSCAILGVPPSLDQKYSSHIDEKSGTFTCFDNTKKIPLSKLNDNYRDCNDGSDEPGTSLGPTDVNFYCRNENYIPYEIPRWSVGDGICDCCDGSDEQKSSSHSKCEDTCKKNNKERKKLNKKITSILEEGLKIRENEFKEGEKKRSSIEYKKNKYQTKIGNFFYKIKKIKNGEKTPTPTPQFFFPDEFENWEDPKNENSEIIFFEIDLNENENEKNENGSDGNESDSSKQPQEPIYKPKKNLSILVKIWKFIFFVNQQDIAFSEVFMRQKDGRVRLYKDKIAHWKNKISIADQFDGFSKENLPSEFISIFKNEFTFDDFKLTFLKEMNQGGTSLGSYKTFSNNSNTDKDLVSDVKRYISQKPTMNFDNGAHCWQTKSGRKTELRLVCSNENKLVSVVEADICYFKGVFATPGACTQDDINFVKNLTVSSLKEYLELIGKSEEKPTNGMFFV
ncbi:hypothetical protein TRFO_19414 [Tritrichomonas foetus]|uniref:Glucosidase 2 subunit beta n=1 Tax=Tritrichomonas foetus TaxID=1144522 RepID=A0A1J4KIW3_9EUKA|nr:hypothetical protein TRFO_19414 [Tritrichomonas foetus]|eukprot:OHT11026.1 hypothetical protein TRFO_19414 [Tritrichomonas foetus]